MLQKLIGTIILVPVAIVIIALSVANRSSATLSFDPVNAQPLYFLEAPLYLFLFGAFAAGGIVASVVTWVRQGRWRRRAREEAARADRAEREVERLYRATGANAQTPVSSLALTAPANRHRDAA